MKSIDLNFSSQLQRQHRRRDLLMLIIILLLLAFVSNEYWINNQQLEQRIVQHQPLAQQRIMAPLSERDRARQKLAASLVTSLNTPWYQMLDALENVKQNFPEIYLTTLVPDVQKQNIVLSGQVARLDTLLAFVDALNEQSLFNDVLPLSQRELVSNGNGIEFSLIVGWNNNE